MTIEVQNKIKNTIDMLEKISIKNLSTSKEQSLRHCYLYYCHFQPEYMIFIYLYTLNIIILKKKYLDFKILCNALNVLHLIIWNNYINDLSKYKAF